MQINSIGFRPQKQIATANVRQNNFSKLSLLKADTVSFSGKFEDTISNPINKLPVENILSKMGINVLEKDEAGMLTIDTYKLPKRWREIGIDEDRLFEKIKRIAGDADFDNSQVTNLGNLEIIDGDAKFSDSKITDLGNLEIIGRNVFFGNSEITSLGRLKTIGGDAKFSYSQVTNLGNLETIGGHALFLFSKITDLGNLKTIGGDAKFSFSNVTNLGNLEIIGRNAYFAGSQITAQIIDSSKLKEIGGKAYFEQLFWLEEGRSFKSGRWLSSKE